MYLGWLENYMFSGHGQNFVYAFLAVCKEFHSEHESALMLMDFRDSQNGIC